MKDCGHEEEHAYSAARAKLNMPNEETLSSLAAAFKTIWCW